jgi:branched-chain amino acid transport system substrate-binding protein
MDGAAYCAPLADQVAATARDVVAGRDTVQPGRTDFSAILSKIKAAKADAVVYAGYAPEGGLLVKQMRGAGVDAQLIGGDGLYGADFVKAAGHALLTARS